MHDISRLAAGPSIFEGKTEAQFAHSPLPHTALAVLGIVLPWCEGLFGFFILIGFWTRITLIDGSLLMIVLCSGPESFRTGRQPEYNSSTQIAYMLLIFLLDYNA